MFKPKGVFLGQFDKTYLRHDGPEHVLTFAPTRSGKGVGLVVPTLLSWAESAVIHDIIGENWQLTAGWRSKFSHCLLFDPTNPESAKYNPLLEVRKGPNEVRDVQNIADILVDPEGRWNGAPIGKRPDMPCWSAPSFMFFMQKKKRPSLGSRLFYQIPSAPLNARSG